MSRTIQDPDFHLWEAYASAGDSGFPARAHIVFHCLTDMGRKARVAEREGSKAEVEKEIATFSAARLGEILDRATELT